TEFDETVVRIDDDDLQLHTMDTIDLTGLYPADAAGPASGGATAVERRAS
ncbi:MAG: hypothetical protein JO242_26425, partial [Streptosporangiaceae bacterium]|nr:hypothetical protein [Streptosporangiaceae bacterium]